MPVATGRGDARLEVVTHHLAGDPTEEGEGIDVAAQPVCQPLRPAGLGIGQVGGTEGGNEDLCRAHLAEQALSERVALPHGRR
jgi:hypothetical protein